MIFIYRNIKTPAFWLGVFFLILQNLNAQDILYRAHGHNDYEKNFPLEKALKNKLISIEIDLFAYEGSLVVAHMPINLESAPLLRDLYLEPLKKWIYQHDGLVYPPDSASLILYFDFKSSSDTCYRLLKQELMPYINLFTEVQTDACLKWGPLIALIDGPDQEVINDLPGIFFLGGSVSDSSSVIPSSIMPRISSSYRSYFSWRGIGQMPEEELLRLRKIVADAHHNGRELRFWAAGNRKKVWKLLLDEGVDYINIDRYNRFRRFYRNYQK